MYVTCRIERKALVILWVIKTSSSCTSLISSAVPLTNSLQMRCPSSAPAHAHQQCTTFLLGKPKIHLQVIHFLLAVWAVILFSCNFVSCWWCFWSIVQWFHIATCVSLNKGNYSEAPPDFDVSEILSHLKCELNKQQNKHAMIHCSLMSLNKQRLVACGSSGTIILWLIYHH